MSDHRIASQIILSIGIALNSICVIGCEAPVPFTTAERHAIADALTKSGLPQPVELGYPSGTVVAVFEVTPAQMHGSAEQFGKTALLTIRNALYPKPFDHYRVSVNGPPPGPGLVARYGTARFHEGGTVTWSQ